jgi:glycosyltransferase 2 family protein
VSELATTPAAPAVESRPAPQLRRVACVGLLLGVPTSALFLYLALRHVDSRAVLDAVRSANAPAVLSAVAAMGIVYLLQAYRWRSISRLGRELPMLRFFEYVLRSVACNNAVPGRPGDLLRAHWLARGARVTRVRALATVVVDRAADVLTLVVALVVTYGAVDHPGWLRRLQGGALVLAALLLCLLLLVYRRAGNRGDARRTSGFRRVAGELTTAMKQGVAGNGLSIVTTSALAWAAWAMGAWLVAHSLGVGLSIVGAVFVTAILNLGSMLPSSPGFVGTYQWLSVASLGLLGTGRTEAVAFSLLMQAVWFVPTTIVGGCLALRAGVSWVIFNPAKAVKAHAT